MLIGHINVLFCTANAEINVIGNYIHMLPFIVKRESQRTFSTFGFCHHTSQNRKTKRAKFCQHTVRN